MSQKDDIENISQHVEVLNHELGQLILTVNLLKNDTKWIKYILTTLTIPIALLAIRVIFG